MIDQHIIYKIRRSVSIKFRSFIIRLSAESGIPLRSWIISTTLNDTCLRLMRLLHGRAWCPLARPKSNHGQHHPIHLQQLIIHSFETPAGEGNDSWICDAGLVVTCTCIRLKAISGKIRDWNFYDSIFNSFFSGKQEKDIGRAVLHMSKANIRPQCCIFQDAVKR